MSSEQHAAPDEGTLRIGEYHPAADSALAYLQKLPASTLSLYQEAFASNAIEGNRLASICSSTLYRLTTGIPVSDRYLLGLVWTIKSMEEAHTVSESKLIVTNG